MMKYRITHQTHYHYNDTVTLCHNEAHLIPRSTPTQNCLNSQLIVNPLPIRQEHRQDFFGNRVTYFAIESPHQELIVTCQSEMEIQPFEVSDYLSPSPPWESVRDAMKNNWSPIFLEAREMVLDSPFISANELLYYYAQPSFPPRRPLLEAVSNLMQRIYTEFTYDPHFTTIVTPLEDVLSHRRGVCQDFAHLMIGCIRTMGLAARYVSGYLETLPPPGWTKLRGSDASHAWLAVYVPNQGWIDFDPTNNKIPTTQHLTTAWGRDYGDVTPLKGIIFGGSESTLTVSVDVDRIEMWSGGMEY